MQDHSTQDDGSAVRRARFGALPERIAREDMIGTKAASPRDPERDAGTPGAGEILTCLAWDMVL
ncbi:MULTISPECIES: hypothetical protein [Streptomyces]|uniref:Uncharacterized protein n=2 Tax=Streptomyces TaxID=1883 RepID=A0A2N8PN12_STRNR|nr:MULTISPECIES: hypothetical protein [Streptomyces]PNE42412.1 hypothetical protein AOB60_18245 [Streptomyces noursei]SHK81056.1 hypothetical protein SAMN05216268_101387 [Streptomyces yunnanensis]